MRGFFAAVLAIGLGTAAPAQEMNAIAISPDGKTILAAGDNRTLYTIDPETLAVTHRRYVPDMIKEMVFSADGSSLFVRTENRNFRAHSAGSFKVRHELAKVYAMSYAPDADRIALLESNHDGGVLHVRSAGSGKSIARIEFPDIDTEMIALAPDGRSALILTDSDKSDDEPKENPPNDLKDWAKRDFRQRNDGYVSNLLSVNLTDQSFTSSPTFFRVKFPDQVMMHGGRALYLKGISDSASIGADGSGVLLDLGKNYVSHGWISDDGSQIVLNGGTDIRIHTFDGDRAVEPASTFKVDRLDGPSERATAIDAGPDGTIYLVTNAYRLWKIAPGGSEVVAVPIN